MPAPVVFSPLAARLLIAGGALLAAAAMRARRAPSSVARDDALDMVDEGVAGRVEAVGAARQGAATARMRRVVRFGRGGPGVEIDIVGVLRARVRPVPPERSDGH